MLPGLGPLEQSAAGSSLDLLTTYGLPLVGLHPAFQDGRFVVSSTSDGASTAAGRGQGLADPAAKETAGASGRAHAQGGGSGSSGGPPPASRPQLLCPDSDGYQLSPLLGKMAADVLCGAHVPDFELGGGQLGKSTQGVDTWADLQRLQRGQKLSKREAQMAIEEGEEERREQERRRADSDGASEKKT